MRRVWKYIFILAVGFAMGLEFTKQSKTLSLAMESGMQSKSVILEEVHKILTEKDETRKTQSSEIFESSDNNRLDLSSFSFHELSSALKVKSKTFEVEYLDQYKLSKEDQDYKKKKEEVFDQLASVGGVSSNWLTQTELSIKGDTIPLLITAYLYTTDQHATMTDSIDLSKLTSDTICWVANFYLDHKGEKYRISSSDCNSNISKDNKYYLSVDTFDISSLNHFLFSMMVTLPSHQGGEVEYLLPGEDTWKKTSPLSWSTMTSEEADKFNDDHKDYKWDF